MNELITKPWMAVAFQTMDEDNPIYGVIINGRIDSYHQTSDEAWWTANDYNAQFVDEEAMSRP